MESDRNLHSLHQTRGTSSIRDVRAVGSKHLAQVSWVVLPSQGGPYAGCVASSGNPNATILLMPSVVVLNTTTPKGVPR